MINEKNTLTSLRYWFPLIQNLGIPVPKTIIVPVEPMGLLKQELSPGFITALKSMAKSIGYPVFMKTDLCAGKHDWKNTCFVPNEEALLKNLYPLAEFNEMADICGLPYTSIVLREFLNLETAFEAFPGKMPINKERRYFIKDGEVICHHPYWPEEAFERDGYSFTKDPDWREKLAKLNYEDDDEVIILTCFAKEVGKVLPGFWSVDFAKTKDGVWYLIDMAVGQASYHWAGCPNEGLRKFE